MFPSNIKKFQYTEFQRKNFQNLVHEALDDNLIICPSHKAVYAWNIPQDSPNSVFGCWSKLIHISPGMNGQPTTLWDRHTGENHNTQHPQIDIKDIIMSKKDIYYVPMNQVYYTNNENYKLYVQNNNINFFIDFDNAEELFKVSQNEDIGVMYNLTTNTKINYTLDIARNMWSNPNPMDVEGEGGWDVCYTSPRDETDEIMKMINEAYESQEEGIVNKETGEVNSNLVYGGGDDSDDDEDDDEDEDSDDDSEYDDGEEDDSEYDDTGSREYSDTDDDNYPKVEEPNLPEDIPNDECPDVKDNLCDEDRRVEYRMDETNGRYYTKAEFMEYYGYKKMWKAMNPKKKMRRYALYYANYYSSHLSVELRQNFIHDYLKTYSVHL